MKKRAGTKKKHGHNMIPFLNVMAVIPWAIILMVTYLLYRRVKPQLRLLWANAKAVWAAQHAAQAAPKNQQRKHFAGPCSPCTDCYTVEEEDIIRKKEELLKAQNNAGFKLRDADYVVKTPGKA